MDRRSFLKSAAAMAAVPVATLRHRRRRRRSSPRRLPQAPRARRAQGRQRRAQHARAVHRPDVLRAASEDRHRARPVVQLSDRAGLHPSLAPLRARGTTDASPCCRAWAIPIRTSRTSARSRSGTRRARARRTLQDGWLTRAFATQPVPASFAADGVIIGSSELGPLAGGGTRAIALADTEQFLRRARLAQPAAPARQQGARAHPQGRGRHRAGGLAPVGPHDVRDRVSRTARSATRFARRARSSPIPPASQWCASRCRVSTRTRTSRARKAALLGRRWRTASWRCSRRSSSSASGTTRSC